MFVYATPFTDATIQIPYANIMKVLIIMIVPISIGIILNHKSKRWAKIATIIGTTAGMLNIAFLLIYAFFVRTEMVTTFPVKMHVIVAAIALLGFILYEGKRHNIRHLWFPILGTCTVGVSFGLPLFLFMREVQLSKGS